MNGNREYKSDVFCMLMEDPVNALSVYNALNGTNYTDPSLVEIKNLDKGVSLTVHNDAAFIVDSNLSIFEHQSTVCPNMPMRSLIYFSNIIDKNVKKKNIYGRGLVKIPTPRFVVFYNGDEDQPETYKMKLSDAFIHPTDEPELELTCTVYNINYGKNKDLIKSCSILRDYMIFVDNIRDFLREDNNLEEAINLGIQKCIEDNVLKDFLQKHYLEVVKVTKLDYTFDRQITLERADAREEGHAEGLEEGRAEGLEEGLAEGRIEGMIESICYFLKDIGNPSDSLITKLHTIKDMDELRFLNKKAATSENIAEFEKILEERIK